MAIKLIEGFDNISSNALLNTKGWVTTVSNNGSISLTAGRLAGNAMRFARGTTDVSDNSSVFTIGTAYTQSIVGFALKMSALPIAGGNAYVIILRDVSTNNVLVFYITTGGIIVIKNGSGGTIATGSTALVSGSWYYIEVKTIVNGASGSVTVQLNGTTEIATTTGNFGSAGVNAIVLIQNASSAWPDSTNIDIDDLYFLDSSASPNNTFLGDVRVSTLYPSGAGAHTQWAPDSGSNYARVNEHSGTYPDGDTSYVSDSTSGDRDSYAFDDLPSLTGTVFGVQTTTYARKDDAATRQICAVARPVSTDRDGATVSLSTSYLFFREVRETNPDTSSAWAISEVNASEFGIKVI